MTAVLSSPIDQMRNCILVGTPNPAVYAEEKASTTSISEEEQNAKENRPVKTGKDKNSEKDDKDKKEKESTNSNKSK